MDIIGERLPREGSWFPKEGSADGHPAFGSHPAAMADYRKLHVWRKAHALALAAHRAAVGIRGNAYSALRSQIIRAAMSIPANIVEGRAQRTDRDFARFLRYAAASAAELEYHLTVARDLGLLSAAVTTALLEQLAEVQRMLHGLITKLESSTPAPRDGRVAT